MNRRFFYVSLVSMNKNIKVLLDTNVIIALEDDHVINSSLQSVTRICMDNDFKLCIHHKTKEDVFRDNNLMRKSITESKLSKYHEIKFTKEPSASFLEALGGNSSRNSVVDNNLLFALNEDIVSFLITEDIEMHKKSRRVGIDDRIFTVNEFLLHLEQLFEETLIFNPEIRVEHVANLDKNDPLFVSIQKTYPQFNNWLQKCVNEDRRAWVSFLGNNKIAGICIFNPEYVDGRKKLKLCTFKTSNESSPYLGEYLLYQALQYASENGFYSTFLEIYSEISQFELDEEERKRLLMMPSWLESFGFINRGDTNKPGEVMYEKLFTLDGDASLSNLEFAIKKWPSYRLDIDANAYVIPIQESFFEILFPCEITKRLMLFSTTANRTMKKVYLCLAQTNNIPRGSLLFFYCSGRKNKQEGAILAVGIAEDSWKGHDKEHLLSFAGKRSVYTITQINDEYCYHPSIKTLAIKFRFLSGLSEPLTFSKLWQDEILHGPPQSILQLKRREKEIIFSLLKK